MQSVPRVLGLVPRVLGVVPRVLGVVPRVLGVASVGPQPTVWFVGGCFPCNVFARLFQRLYRRGIPIGPCATHPFTLGLVGLLGGATLQPLLSTPIPSGEGSAPRVR